MLSTSEERIAILKMIEDDKIDAEQGLRLLEAVGTERKSTVKAGGSIDDKNGRQFRVLVTNTQTGKVKTQVTLPMILVDWGLRVGARFSTDVEGINLEELGELLRTTSHGKIVDVLDEEDGEHVEIFID